MLSDCKCLEIGEKQILLDTLTDSILYNEKIKQKKKSTEIELFQASMRINNIRSVQETVNDIEICKISR